MATILKLFKWFFLLKNFIKILRPKTSLQNLVKIDLRVCLLSRSHTHTQTKPFFAIPK